MTEILDWWWANCNLSIFQFPVALNEKTNTVSAGLSKQQLKLKKNENDFSTTTIFKPAADCFPGPSWKEPEILMGWRKQTIFPLYPTENIVHLWSFPPNAKTQSVLIFLCRFVKRLRQVPFKASRKRTTETWAHILHSYNGHDLKLELIKHPRTATDSYMLKKWLDVNPDELSAPACPNYR